MFTARDVLTQRESTNKSREFARVVQLGPASCEKLLWDTNNVYLSLSATFALTREPWHSHAADNALWRERTKRLSLEPSRFRLCSLWGCRTSPLNTNTTGFSHKARSSFSPQAT
uniref:Uncharacterized protein n=1 Tax=Vespula pensylvanica TaxID=30213 RepID=A0A834NZ67_VESPE|nr:hypothetical protein H0235_009822 [Vespula pensylvanica]